MQIVGPDDGNDDLRIGGSLARGQRNPPAPHEEGDRDGGAQSFHFRILSQGITSCNAEGVINRFENLFHDLQRYITGHGVRVALKAMDIEKPGEFDGLTVTINPRHAADARSFYLAHAFGSIVQWSTDFKTAEKVFEELRAAAEARRKEPAKLEAALKAYRRFEQTSSEYAVWLLEQIGHRTAIAPYTIFFRADIEAMTILHRTGRAPEWPEFYAQWKRLAKSGGVWVEPFIPKPFSRFKVIRIEAQEVLQERGA